MLPRGVAVLPRGAVAVLSKGSSHMMVAALYFGVILRSASMASISREGPCGRGYKSKIAGHI